MIIRRQNADGEYPVTRNRQAQYRVLQVPIHALIQNHRTPVLFVLNSRGSFRLSWS